MATKGTDDDPVIDGGAGTLAGRDDVEVLPDGAIIDRRRVIVHAAADRERLAARLEGSGLGIGEVAGIGGVPAELISLEGDEDIVDRALALGRRVLGDGRIARVTPRHLFVGAPYGRGHPGGIPVPASAPQLPALPKGRARRPRVAVLDSGYLAGVSPELDARVTGATVEPGPLDGAGWRVAAAGHGTFIAGLIARLAPDAAIEMRAVFQPDATVFEDDVAAALVDVAQDPPDVVSMSFGGWTVDDRMPAAIAQALALLPPTTVVIAAAGNERSSRPRFPAADDRVVAVTAMRRRGVIADFANHGPWVDCAAPGVDLVSTFIDCEETASPVWLVQKGFRPVRRRPERFACGASWSGSSFAAPWLAGKVLAGMSGPAGAKDARRALVRLLSRGTLGSRYNVGVLLPFEAV